MKKLLPCTALVMCAGMACAQAEERNDWHFNIGAMYEIENVEGYGEDMDGEGKTLSLEQVKKIHHLKTGRMLTFPFVAAGIIAEQSEAVIAKLREIGQNLGLAFQIRDDIIDVTGTFEEIGKTPGKDQAEEKSTYVALLGLKGAQEALEELLTAVKSDLAQITSSAEIVEIIESLEIK